MRFSQDELVGVRLGGQELGVQVGGFAAVAWRAAELRAVEPSAGAVPERDQHGRGGHGLAQLRVPLDGKGGVGVGERHHLAVLDHRVQGRAQQIQVTVVAGGGGSGQDGDGDGRRHDVVGLAGGTSGQVMVTPSAVTWVPGASGSGVPAARACAE
jgi:hypothetical protein